jgi:hypothetical protein
MAYAESDTLSSELLELASSKIDELTYNRIVSIGFDNLTQFQKDKIERATILQAQYYEDYGVDIEMLGGFSLPGISMNLKDNASSTKGFSPSAYSLLKQTGLTVRVV